MFKSKIVRFIIRFFNKPRVTCSEELHARSECSASYFLLGMTALTMHKRRGHIPVQKKEITHRGISLNGGTPAMIQ